MSKKRKDSHPASPNNNNPAGAQASPMGELCDRFMDADLHKSLDQRGSLYMRALCDQFASAAAEGNLESAMAMLAGCPALARMPCSKSLVSALHYSCTSLRLAALTRALLALGCDPQGTPKAPGQGPDGTGSPLRWAASCGSLGSLQALIQAGAKPKLGDLHEACRQGRGDCAAALLAAAPKLNPFRLFGHAKRSCDGALREAVRERQGASMEDKRRSQAALAAFERWAIKHELDKPQPLQRGGSQGRSEGSKRL